MAYWELCALGVLAYVYLCVRAALPDAVGSQRVWDVLSPTIAVLCFLLLRWPTLYARDVFIDESQMLAQAMTALHDPVPWVSFDGTTSGPLDTYLLSLPLAFGVPPSVFDARLVSSGLIVALIFAQYWVVRPIYGGSLARLSLGVLILLFGLGSSFDLRMYASELLPIVLVTIALAFAAVIASEKRLGTASLIVAGLCCGAIPFAKLQGVPLAAASAGLVVAALFWHDRPLAVAWRRIGIFLLSCVAPAVAILIPVTLRGGYRDFFISYIAQSLTYSHTRETVHLKWAYFFTPEYRMFFPASLVTIVAFAALWLGATLARPWRNGNRRFLQLWAAPAAGLGLLLVAWYSIAAAHHDYYSHYWLLIVEPLTLTVVAFGGALRESAPPRLRWIPYAGFAVYLLACAVPIAQLAVAQRPALLANAASAAAPAKSAVEQTIAAIRQGRMAIWGYSPQLYVDTGSLLGTRDAITQFAIIHGRYRDYYRRRFLNDLRTNRPEIFVDSVGPSDWAFKIPRLQGLQSFPELAGYVTGNYTLVANVDGMHVFRLRAP